MRLPLLPPASLSPDQKDLYDDMVAVIEKNFGELVARRADGALIGPFNGWLHFPHFVARYEIYGHEYFARGRALPSTRSRRLSAVSAPVTSPTTKVCTRHLGSRLWRKPSSWSDASRWSASR